MKRLVLCSVMLVFGLSAVAEAQPLPNMFTTMAACSAALESGAFRFYEPKYFGLRTVNPVNGVDRVAVPLESNMCLDMLVVGGRQFVVQREGTIFRARKLADGSLVLYARDDCGNPVFGVVISPRTEPPARMEFPRRHQYVPEPEVELMHPRMQRVRQRPATASAEKKSGFCSSKKCRWALVAIGGAAAGYAAYYYWPCPAGTVRK